MPAYVRFIQNGTPIRGSVPSGVHMGWTELVGFDVAPQAGETPPMLWLLTSRAQTSPPLRLRESAAPVGGRGSHPGGANFAFGDGSVRLVSDSISRRTAQPGARTSRPGGINVGMADGSVRMLSSSAGRSSTDVTAELDFTNAHDNVGELIVLRALVHGVRVVGCEPVPDTGRAGNDVAIESIVIVHEGMTRAGALRSSPDISHQVRGQRGFYSWAYQLRRSAHFDLYDYPGEYAQRFDGVSPGRGSAQAQHWEHSYEFRPGKWTITS
jgi:prepilin-type processing-associated H-X9-DG protein